MKYVLISSMLSLLVGCGKANSMKMPDEVSGYYYEFSALASPLPEPYGTIQISADLNAGSINSLCQPSTAFSSWTVLVREKEWSHDTDDQKRQLLYQALTHCTFHSLDYSTDPHSYMYEQLNFQNEFLTYADLQTQVPAYVSTLRK